MTPTPKLWRDMTPEEKGALLLAEHEGKVIQWNGTSVLTGQWTGWDDCDDDCLWDGVCAGDGFAYRIKPEPKRETVVLYGGEQCLWDFYGRAAGVMHKSHKITFDVIDGEPVEDSVKMEKLT